MDKELSGLESLCVAVGGSSHLQRLLSVAGCVIVAGSRHDDGMAFVVESCKFSHIR